MKRRAFLRNLGYGVGMSAVASSSWARSERQRQPNVLIIHTDQHNFRTLGCYRETLTPDQAFVWGEGVKVDTPHIDRLAHEGALCTRFYATSPVCSPSRAAFVSGMYPQRTPVTNNNVAMSDKVVTFAEILRREGYATGYLGKWHLDGKEKPQWAPQRHFGFEDNAYMFNRGHWKQLEDGPEGPRVKSRGKNGKPDYGIDGADETSFTTDFLTTKTLEFIERSGDRPFCCMVSIPDPHGPILVRPPYDKQFADLPFTMPRTALKKEEGVPSWASRSTEGEQFSPDSVARYFGMVKCIDDNVGRMLSTLEKRGILDDTIVVFTSDHGDMMGEHGRFNKGVPLEGSAKIPFILRYPPKVKAGTLVREALGCVDFLPTLMALMEIETQHEVDGRDASSLFVKGQQPPGWEDVTFLRKGGSGERGWIAAVTSRFKLVLSSQDPPWLVDLEKDPDELINCIDSPECKSIGRALASQLKGYCELCKDPYLDVPGIRKSLADLLQ